MMRTAQVALALGAILFFVSLLGQSYLGRVRLVDAQRHDCAFKNLDRADNASGWWIAEEARIKTADDPLVLHVERDVARVAAEREGQIAARLEARSETDCRRIFPEPSFAPWRG